MSLKRNLLIFTSYPKNYGNILHPKSKQKETENGVTIFNM